MSKTLCMLVGKQFHIIKVNSLEAYDHMCLTETNHNDKEDLQSQDKTSRDETAHSKLRDAANWH